MTHRNAITLASTSLFAQTGFPECTVVLSDPDGDGYGWENNQTCIVSSGPDSPSAGQCEDHGGYPWGWNPVTLESCRLDSDTSSNNSQIGIDLIGNWYCQSQITTSGYFEPPQNRAPAINDTVEWVGFGGSISQGGPGPCDESGDALYTTNGATYPGISKYVFNNDGGLTVSKTLTSITVNCPSGDRTSHSFETIEYGNWSFDGNSLTVNSEVMSEFGIQYKSTLVASQSNPGQSEEVSFRLLNFYIDNAHRLSCRNTGSDLTPRLIW